MRKAIPYLFATCAVAAFATLARSDEPAAGASAAGEVQFEDNFEALDSAWGQAPEYGVKDGKFFIELEPGKARWVLNEANLFNEIDATVLVAINKLDDPTKGDAGLIFWAQGYSNFHALMVTVDGRFRVERYSSGKYWTNPLEYAASDALKKGLGETNELRVVTKEHNVTIYINGIQAASFKGQPPDGPSMIGLAADSWSAEPSRYEFAQLKVK